MLMILAGWTSLCGLVVVVSFIARADDIAAYEQAMARHGAYGVYTENIIEHRLGVTNPWPDIGMIFGLSGCCWLPIAVAFLIASIALWSRRM